MTEQVIFSEIKTFPETLKKEVLDYVLFLSDKYQNKKNAKKIPVFGGGKVKISMHADFDEPLDEFKEYM
jgi:Protein of unknown function (DUF2281)